MLEIKNLQKIFNQNLVLKGIDLTVEKGDVIAIVGPSGSGKTTLLRCINFLEKADKGSMKFDNQDFDLSTINKKDILKLRQKTGFVFQNFNLFRNKNVLKNVTEGLITVRKIKKEEAEQTAIEVLKKVGMEDKLESYPYQISGGQQQRVAIGRALFTRPALILADEPTGNLDTQNTSEVITLLKETSRKYEQTIVMITHSRSVAQTADRVLQVSDGQLTDLGRCRE